jgi:hypothetical protein
VPEHERGDRRFDRPEVCPGRSVRSLELEHAYM